MVKRVKGRRSDVAPLSCIRQYVLLNWGAKMGKPEEPYIRIIVETYHESGGGLHGDVHVRPIAGQQISQDLRVRFPKASKTRLRHRDAFSSLCKAHRLGGRE
jgi:hypothetical protein